MIYIIKKMYKAYGNFIDNYSELKGINPIFKTYQQVKNYPNNNDVLGSLEAAATIHKEVRKFIQPYLRPGIKLIDIAELIELKTEELTKSINLNNPINKGIGFPVGLSINECAAHYHPAPNSNVILKKDDIIKIDFGVEVNSWIIDSAFTVYFNSKYDQLAEAVKDATYTGIKNINVDVNIGDWGAKIQEVMESYEIKLNNTIKPIRCINNLGGHNITQGIIHGGIFLPTVDMRNTYVYTPDYRFKEGVYAVETFGSTGDNNAIESPNFDDVTLYRLNPKYNKQLCVDIISSESIDLLKKINLNFITLPFTDRYIKLYNIQNYKQCLKELTKNKIIHSYPPLYINSGDYSAQYEHTIYIGDTKKIIFSQSDDY